MLRQSQPVAALVLSLAILTSCGGKLPSDSDRYQMVNAPKEKIFKLDSVTGQTWILESRTTNPWKFNPSPYTASVEGNVRAVIKRAVEPLITDVKVYNPKTKQLEKPGNVEARQRLETIVQDALKTFQDLQGTQKTQITP